VNESLVEAAPHNAPPVLSETSPDLTSRTIGGVPLDWPEEGAPAEVIAGWEPGPSVPWASPKPSAVFDPQQGESIQDWGAPSSYQASRQASQFENEEAEPLQMPFVQNGSPLPEGMDAVALFQPDGTHEAISGFASQNKIYEGVEHKQVAVNGGSFSPQLIRSEPPAPEPVSLHLIQGSTPVIPDWEPGIPVPILNEPRTDSCLPTADSFESSVEDEPVALEGSGFTWDQVLAPAKAPETADESHPAQAHVAESAHEPAKSTPPPAWGAPAWGRPRLAKDPEPASSPVEAEENSAEGAETALAEAPPILLSQAVEAFPGHESESTELIGDKPSAFGWPQRSESESDLKPLAEEIASAGLDSTPFAWPDPAPNSFEESGPVFAPEAFSTQQEEPAPFAWPDPVSEPVESFAEEVFEPSASLPPVLEEPEAIAWPSSEFDRDIPAAIEEFGVEAEPHQFESVAVEPEPEAELESAPEAAPAFSWPEPVMELPPVSVLETDLDDLPPLDQLEPASLTAIAAPPVLVPPPAAAPEPADEAETATRIEAEFDNAVPQEVVSDVQAVLTQEEAVEHEIAESTTDLESPINWGSSHESLPPVLADQPTETAEPVGLWQDEEPGQVPAHSEPEGSQTWGLPSTWMTEPVTQSPTDHNTDDRWVSADEDEKVEEVPEPVAAAAPAIDPEKEIEKSLERLFTLNRSFRWKKVGELLQELGLVSEADLNEALKTQKETKRPLGKTLVEMGIISDRLLLKVLAAQKDVIPWYFDDALEPDLLALLEPEFCLRCQVLPVRQQGVTLTLVMRNPSDVDTIDFVQHTTGLRVEPALGEEETLAKKIEEGYSRDARSHRAHVDALVLEAFKSSDIKVSHIDENKSATAIEEETRPVSAIVQKLIAEAIKMRASDIHMEPTMHDLQIRYRIDGRLHKVNSVPKEIQPMIAARVKIMAELDPVEWRIPQDGRISFEIDRRVVDLRVSVLPSFYGSRIVMRLLDRSAGVKSLDDIGFSSNNLSIFKTLIKRPYGLFLVTGPTGSGKTTSLYAALNEVKDEETNIITCEDPVEYNLDGISQSQVNAKIGLTFAAQLRSILRQDPDVVLVGEIRDHETAETAIRASMTGHLVFSTLHCNDAPSAIPRLLDMNIDPFLLSTSLIGVMGQRLIRRICPDCGAAYKPSQDETTILERTFGLVGVDKLYKGTGCVRCAHTGFKGRFAVHEIMPVTQEISSYIADRASTEKLGEISRFYGYRTMQEDTLERVLAGQTTLKEAQRLLAFDDIPRIEPGSKKK
jgi:type IV pilus assembly protein PilB